MQRVLTQWLTLPAATFGLKIITMQKVSVGGGSIYSVVAYNGVLHCSCP